MEKVTLFKIAVGRSGDTSRRGEDGNSSGDEHLMRFSTGISSMVSRLSRLSNERFRETTSAASMEAARLLRTTLDADSPKALSLVLRRTISVISGEVAECSISSRLKEKDLSIKQGAPGPPNRIIAPRLTLWGTDNPSREGEDIRRPFKNVP